MHTPTAIAALFCAGLATGPTLASSTTIIDFTIEVTEIEVNPITGLTDPLFQRKTVGDTFNGILEIANPPVDTVPLPGTGGFRLEDLAIDGFDPGFFADAAIFSQRSRSYLDSDSFDPIARRGKAFFMAYGFLNPSDIVDADPDNLSVDDVFALLTGNDEAAFIAESDTEFFELKFDVTSASIRPDTTPIPLPAAGWLMVAGLGGLAALRHRG